MCADWERLATIERPHCLLRFGDGELAMLAGRQLAVNKPHEQWRAERAGRWSELLRQSLLYRAPDYTIAISCPCCAPADHQGYRRLLPAGAAAANANLLVNGNYDRTLARARQERWLERCCLVGSYDPAAVRQHRVPYHFRVPRDLIRPETLVGLAPAVTEILCSIPDSTPILLAAGPASNCLGLLLWMTGSRQRAILDVGSIFDPLLHGAPTRGYHHHQHPNRQRRCPERSSWPN